ncbi:MAG: transglutaminase-like domain-containing protein [Thermoguttaceae bacterium]
MSMRSLIVFFVLCLGMTAPIWAQFKDSEDQGIKLGETKVQRWRAGMIITALAGACKGINGYAPIPIDWPEQKVSIVAEDISPVARVTYKVINGTVKIMSVKIPHLTAGQEAKALVTLEIRRRTMLPPDDTDIYVLPDVKKMPFSIRQYLTPSPKIESRDRKIRVLAKQIVAEREKAWEKVEAIYDRVRKEIKYKVGAQLRGAIAALKDHTGDCEDLTSLFIALCRAENIPARTVWVPSHCYPEFYLEDDKGKGHWFPCQVAGSYQFGGISEDRPILAKGDNFKPLLGRGENQRYLSEFLIGTPADRGGGRPRVKFVRELLGPNQK